MAADKPVHGRDYAAILLEFLDPVEHVSSRPNPPSKRRGRTKKLTNQLLGSFFKAIAEVNSKNKHCASNSSIAGKLKGRPQYSHLSDRQLRRDVGEALAYIAETLKTVPPQHWERKFGISPPAAMTKKLLHEKVLEFLRHRLTQHQLMAKTLE